MFLVDWFQGKKFTSDWTSNKLDLWRPILEPYADSQMDVLEVGTFEGRSAITFLEVLPKSKITCIDHFKTRDLEERFDHNVEPYGERVTKLKGRAIGVMGHLLQRNRKYDLIYLDAAKDRASAFTLSSIGWSLLKVGGILIWDDLSWRTDLPPEKRPEPGSRLFMKTFESCFDLLHDKSINDRWEWAGQAIVKKTKEWPDV